DEEIVRAMAVQTLRKQGYTVLEAANGNEALQKVAAHSGPIHIMVTDVVMPQMNGKELVLRLRQSHPDTHVVYTSGYTDHAIVHQGVLEPGAQFLQKPYTPAILARKVRNVLDNSTV